MLYEQTQDYVLQIFIFSLLTLQNLFSQVKDSNKPVQGPKKSKSSYLQKPTEIQHQNVATRDEKLSQLTFRLSFLTISGLKYLVTFPSLKAYSGDYR
jgi:hypothetical protein